MDMVERSRQGRTVIETHRVLEMNSEESRKTYAIAQANQSSNEKIEHSLNQLHVKALDLENIIKSASSAPPRIWNAGGGLQDCTSVMQSSDECASTNVLWSISAVLRKTCTARRTCQCHYLAQVQTPNWIRSVFGSFFLQYNSLPVLRHRTCDIPTCMQQSTQSMRLSYLFPKWLAGRAVYLALSWSSLTGEGSDFHLHVPRVLYDGFACKAIYRNDLEWLRKAIASKRIRPTDINTSGDNLLAVRRVPSPPSPGHGESFNSKLT